MDKIIEIVNQYIWSTVFIVLCVCTGIYFSIRIGFIQFRYVPTMIKLLFAKKKDSQKGISSFQAFSLAISGRVGTGNIVGVASAIAFGGPGAVFWMWVISLLGAASAFAEATLGQLYKQEIKGEYRGGPAYYIEKGLGIKWYAVFFAVITIVSCGLLLPGVQSNSISKSVSTAFEISDYSVLGMPINIAGILVVVLLSLIIFGGVKRLGKVTEIIVPFMAVSYILLVLIIIGFHYKQIPDMLMLIVRSAFQQEQLYAGIIGLTIAWGVKRGIYSNEAGQGTAPHAAAASEVKHPVEQGLVQAFSVYVDTLFICTATALMILFTAKYNVIDKTTDTIITNNIPEVEFTAFTQEAVSLHFPLFGNQFVALALFFFAFTTILAYYYYAETNVSYVFHKTNYYKMCIWILRVIFLIAVYYGTVKQADSAWALGDIGVGLMAWVNIIAILLLSNVVLKVWKDYVQQKKEGIANPEFNNTDAKIKNADFWNK
ncbi:MAG: alanine/glycine:cation symporter family protein [Bacteroidota bacterium]|nr:alanine/glycine:cation symporter family protein [Bacteroidota bacterium]